MNTLKGNSKKQKTTMLIVLLFCAVLLFLISFIISDFDLKTVTRIVGCALVIGGFFAAFVHVGNKPTLEEIEKNQFGDKQ